MYEDQTYENILDRSLASERNSGGSETYKGKRSIHFPAS